MNEKTYLNTTIYIVEEIKAETNELILVNYIFDKRINATISDEKIEFYAKAFDKVLEDDSLLFVEVDEKRGVIVG